MRFRSSFQSEYGAELVGRASLRFGHESRRAGLIVPNRPAISQRRIIAEEVLQTPGETAANVGLGDVIAAHFHTLANPGDGDGRTRQPKVMEIELEAPPFGVLQMPNVRAAAQGAFKGKGFPPGDKRVKLSEQQSSGLYGRGLSVEW